MVIFTFSTSGWWWSTSVTPWLVNWQSCTLSDVFWETKKFVMYLFSKDYRLLQHGWNASESLGKSLAATIGRDTLTTPGSKVGLYKHPFHTVTHHNPSGFTLTEPKAHTYFTVKYLLHVTFIIHNKMLRVYFWCSIMFCAVALYIYVKHIGATVVDFKKMCILWNVWPQ